MDAPELRNSSHVVPVKRSSQYFKRSVLLHSSFERSRQSPAPVQGASRFWRAGYPGRRCACPGLVHTSLSGWIPVGRPNGPQCTSPGQVRPANAGLGTLPRPDPRALKGRESNRRHNPPRSQPNNPPTNRCATTSRPSRRHRPSTRTNATRPEWARVASAQNRHVVQSHTYRSSNWISYRCNNRRNSS